MPIQGGGKGDVVERGLLNQGYVGENRKQNIFSRVCRACEFHHAKSGACSFRTRNKKKTPAKAMYEVPITGIACVSSLLCVLNRTFYGLVFVHLS